MKFRSITLTFLIACAVVAPPFNFAVASPRAAHAAQGEQPGAGMDALRQGRRLLKQGRADQALPLLESALRSFNASGAVRGQAATHDALGDLYSRQGQHRTALLNYQKAHELFQAAGNKPGSIIAKRVVGIGDEEFNANLMLAKIGEALYRVGNISESGTAYARMRVTKPDTSALGVAKKGGGLFSSLSGLGRNVARGEVNVSTGVSAAGTIGQVQQTFELYRQSILYATYELGLGRVKYFNDEFAVARKHFTNALDSASGSVPLIGKIGQMRRFRVAANTSLGDVALRQGNLKDALKFYTDAAKGAQADRRLDLQWPAQRGVGKANLMLAAGQTDAAKRAKALQDAFAAYRAALQTIETIRQGSLRADEARTTFLATTRDVFDEASSAIAAAALDAATDKNAPLTGDALALASESFRIVEQGRARSLLDMLSETGATITAGVPAELLRRKQENLERQQEIAQQITGVSLTGEPPKEGIEQLEEQLETLSVEYDSLENQIRAASPRYGALTSAQPLTLAEVQQKVLDADTVLLEYSLGREQSYLWAVTTSGVSLRQLPARDKLDALAMALRDRVVPQSLRRSLLDAGSQTRGLSDERGLALSNNATTANVAAFVEASGALYRNTIAPVASLVANKRLLVVADGALNYVPFESFVTATGGGGDYSTLPYLVKTNEVAYAPSASVVAAIRQQAASGAAAAANSRGLLLVADPIFDASDPRAKILQGVGAAASGEQSGEMLAVSSAVADLTGAANTAATGSSSNVKLARLNGTRAEAQQIATFARASGLAPDIWLDLDASENKVKTTDVSKYRILHVATHGLLNTERPQFTGVVLSLVGNREGDGFLRTDEIFNLRLGSPLVMLSACETGLGKERRGEGVIGLTRAFMYAGAPTVGVSLWSVADKSTADLMTDFYKRLLAKQAPAPSAAMRAAQVAMIEGKKYSAPFYWAPFVLVGDWR
ncbi:MAG TPA: CHAT domain-containing tetratricopeptide repeat protein [Pyrinomonadaceae bacterium]|jgi:CHAT domain-containing protein|nr:CHAT domain-containing tetratricopeptide repeat protein [Pyrinomonadaceae bacterium]